jgi:hypothetical protein
MRRSAIVTAVVLFTTIAGAAAPGLTSTAGATSRRGPGTSTATAPAPANVRVKAGSAWTLDITGAGCQSDTFAAHHVFTAGTTNGDRGTYKGTRKLTMAWTAGASTGAVFKGTWTRATGHYTGTYASGGATAPLAATLVPAATSACLAMTTAPATASITLGSSDTDIATVTGRSGITPTGTVTFYVCPVGVEPCTAASPGLVDLGTTPVSGSSGNNVTATSAPYQPGATGSYCFLGLYSGDGNYPSASDGSTDECFNVFWRPSPS